MRRAAGSHCVAHGGGLSHCGVQLSRHTVAKHERDIVRYVGREFIGAVISRIEEIYSRGRPQPVPERWRGVEKERRSAIVKFRGKTLRIVVAKTGKCYFIVTAHPYGGVQHDIDLGP